MFEFEITIKDKLSPYSPQRTVRVFFLILLFYIAMIIQDRFAECRVQILYILVCGRLFGKF